ncbi:unnamed protein product, partial [Vitis vinifera]
MGSFQLIITILIRVSSSSSVLKSTVHVPSLILCLIVNLPGTWELIVPNAGIASMHTAVTRYGTVVLLDRTNIGPSRKMLPKGHCRYDPKDEVLKRDCYAHSVILDLNTNKIRPLKILTDTWCSSGQFLPDGSLLQTGGDLDGVKKIRKFVPCGPHGFCDWEELKDVELETGRCTDTPAHGSCGRIVATSPHPVWEMEDMPFGRIMGDMVMLPTGDVLIINGAQAGMYHSTANLLPDGRVLIAGSNPHYFYKFAAEFPTELRIEAFSPEYLFADKANIRPVIDESPEMVRFGEQFDVFVSVSLPVVGSMEVNLASAPFATHSFSQGQRLVKLTVSPTVPDADERYRIVCTAPPGGKIAPPGYYMMFAVNLGVPSVARWVQLVP